MRFVTIGIFNTYWVFTGLLKSVCSSQAFTLEKYFSLSAFLLLRVKMTFGKLLGRVTSQWT